MEKWIEEAVCSFVKKRVCEEITQRIPDIVEEVLRKRFMSDPERELSAVGFNWALVLAFKEAWPDIDHKTAISCASDCLEVPYGTHGYDWSAAAAIELTQDYVRTHGEEEA